MSSTTASVASSDGTPPKKLKLIPDEKPKVMNIANLEISLLSMTIEAAWDLRETQLKGTTKRQERRRIRAIEYHTVLVAGETLRSKEAREIFEGRVVLLRLGSDMGDWEDRYST